MLLALTHFERVVPDLPESKFDVEQQLTAAMSKAFFHLLLRFQRKHSFRDRPVNCKP